MMDALILNSLDEDFPDIQRSTEMNTKHFTAIDGLLLEDWTVATP
jgi:hypothetical protein